MMPAMANHPVATDQLILRQLAHGEMRLLSLVVAVRKALGRFESVKGDLPEMVKAALRKLVSAKLVIEVDGVYALAPSAKAKVKKS